MVVYAYSLLIVHVRVRVIHSFSDKFHKYSSQLNSTPSYFLGRDEKQCVSLGAKMCCSRVSYIKFFANIRIFKLKNPLTGPKNPLLRSEYKILPPRNKISLWSPCNTNNSFIIYPNDFIIPKVGKYPIKKEHLTGPRKFALIYLCTKCKILH